MKKIVFIACLFLSFGSFAQTKITATLNRNSPADTYAVTYDSLQRGGMHVYATIAQRNAIPTLLRKKGMFAAVDTTIYQLKTGITNSDWQIFASGPQGIQGPAGPQGPQGIQGINGPAGATGAAGPIGVTGAAGPQGVQGVQGIKGVDGTVGPAGLNWRGSWASGTSYVKDDAVGYGGSTWFCFLATSGNITPDVDTAHWALLASRGANGLQGVQGNAGPAGATGSQGSTGNTGATGPQGSTGAVGPQGANGAAGATGPQGPQGPIGPQGPQGLNGVGNDSSYINFTTLDSSAFFERINGGIDTLTIVADLDTSIREKTGIPNTIRYFNTAGKDSSNIGLVYSNGNVGIGTTTPNVALDVIGNEKVSFLSTTLPPPVTTGVIKMRITDENGLQSFANIPSSASTYTGTAPVVVTGTVISADTSKTQGKLATFNDILINKTTLTAGTNITITGSHPNYTIGSLLTPKYQQTAILFANASGITTSDSTRFSVEGDYIHVGKTAGIGAPPAGILFHNFRGEVSASFNGMGFNVGSGKAGGGVYDASKGYTFQNRGNTMFSITTVGGLAGGSPAVNTAAFTANVTATGTVTSNQPMKAGGYTVATLPAGVVGQFTYVTDAPTAKPPYLSAVTTGGGPGVVPVFRNNVGWVYH